MTTETSFTQETIPLLLQRMVALEENFIDLKNRVSGLEALIHTPDVPPLTTKSGGFGSIDELVKSIEAHFDCKDGLYGPYAYYRSDTEDRAYYDQASRYRTFGFLTPEREGAAEHLRQALWASLENLCQPTSERPRLTLYWRFAKECRILEEVNNETDSLGQTIPNGRIWRKIRTRVAIPNANWSLVKVVAEGERYPEV